MKQRSLKNFYAQSLELNGRWKVGCSICHPNYEENGYCPPVSRLFYHGKRPQARSLGVGLLFRPWLERRALVFYRGILGGQGSARKREDDTVVRRGLSEKTRERQTTPNERRLAAEVLTHRVQHFTKGMILGSRAFIDGWFAQHRTIVTGRSRTERQTRLKTARQTGPAGTVCLPRAAQVGRTATGGEQL